MKFNTGKEMLEHINSGNDLYSVKAETYVFNYNASGSIATYTVTSEEAKKLSKLSKKYDDYWGAFLGTGGWIWDDPSYEMYEEGSLTNLDRCEELIEFDDWISTDDYLNREKGNV